MKKIALILAAMALIIATAISSNKPASPDKDASGHVLTDLWKKYKDAADADRPQLQLQILEEIKSQATQKQLAWDFWDAATLYRSVQIKRDWHLQDSADKQLRKEALEFENPIVGYAYHRYYSGSDQMAGYVTTHAKQLAAGNNPAFYDNDSRIAGEMSGVLKDYIANDYEYALWSISLGYRTVDREHARDTLAKVLGDTYPTAPYLKYKKVIDYIAGSTSWAETMEEIIEKYSGKAIILYPKAAIALHKLRKLKGNKQSTQEDFKALRAEVAALEKTRKGYSGTEAALVSKVRDFQDIIEEMDSKEISLDLTPEKARILFRNVSTAWIEMSPQDQPGKKVFRQELTNPKNSYYVYDTLYVTIPDVGDGIYSIECGSKELDKDDKQSGVISRFSYAISLRSNAYGYGIFAANAATGMPLQEYTVVLKDDGKEVASAKVNAGQGYTKLPAFKGVKPEDIEDYDIYVWAKDASGFKRMSPVLSVVSPFDPRTKDLYDGSIFLNSAAFHPGGTLKYKVLGFVRNPDNKYAPLKEGEKVEVTISDPEGEDVATQVLELSAMGSAAGELVLPEGRRGGNWSINVDYGNNSIAYEHFYCGDFVLPTYECNFENFEKAIFPKDTIQIKGQLKSFSGHKLSDATVSYKIQNYSTVIQRGEVKPDGDGNFAIEHVAVSGYIYVTLNVTDVTGETLEFQTGFYVSDYVSVDVSLDNRNKEYLCGASDMLLEQVAKFKVRATSNSRPMEGATYKYRLIGKDDVVLTEGNACVDHLLELDMSSYADGQYRITVTADRGNPGGSKPESSCSFVKYTLGAVIPADVDYIFRQGKSELSKGEDITFTLGSGKHPIWAVVELYDKGQKPLVSKTILIPQGKAREEHLPYLDKYGDNLVMTILYFNDYDQEDFECRYFRELENISLPLEITRLNEEAAPGSEITIELETKPFAELVVAVWDKASDAIRKNDWQRIYIWRSLAEMPNVNNAVQEPMAREYYGLYYKSTGAEVYEMMADEPAGEVVMAMGISPAVYGNRTPLTDSIQVLSDSSNDADEAVILSAEDFDAILNSVRSDFKDALFFEPFAKADKDGKVSLTFKASDKLSTYHVAAFAHDDKIHNNLVKKDIVVTVPVKTDVLKPEYLVEGDKFSLTATVSSAVGRDLTGTLTVAQYAGSDFRNATPVSVKSVPVTLPARGVVSQLFEIEMPDQVGHDGATSVIAGPDQQSLGLLISFKGDDGTTDAQFVTVPILDRAQVLTEAHSAVLLAGASKEALMADLRSRFTGTTSMGAEYKEITVLDMVRETLEGKLEESGKDVLSLTEALYVRLALAALGHEVNSSVISSEVEKSLLEKILACQNEDGGFGWFAGFSSSPILTSVVLERFAKMPDQVVHEGSVVGQDEALSRAVKYLDATHFSGSKRPYWCGSISDEQYMYIRALYAKVPFQTPGKEAEKQFKQFKKDAKAHLTPDKARGLNGYIMAKARRLNTLRLLLASEEGLALAKQWGIKTGSKIEKSMNADVTSLLEYAIEHKDGGIYYPNAVMPYRGLLETEAYAHVQLAALLPQVADGIKLWLMLQKETQHWEVTPHYVDAVASILSASQEVLDTKVIILTKTYRKPLDEIKAAGNGFSISREFFREVTNSSGFITLEPIEPGTPVNKGDKIIAMYHVYNAENRSFVRLRAPREATLRPIEQKSGHIGWWPRPFNISGYYFTPQGYRDVHTSYTDYFFDSLAEEKHDFREEFFVTQTGVFACGAPEIESLYAPHYRANGAFAGNLCVAHK